MLFPKDIKEIYKVADCIVTTNKDILVKSPRNTKRVLINNNGTNKKQATKRMINYDSLDDLINDLHPTPAVSCVPKSLCINVIQDIEGFDRSFYAGYSKVDINDTIFYFVNLRCGRLFKNNAELFVGGGITALSSPEKEWRETELKADALMNNIK